MAGPYVISDAMLNRLRGLLRARGGAGTGSGDGSGRQRVALVRCTSATAVGGSAILDECYPAEVFAPASDTALPPDVDEGAGVLLSLLTDDGEAGVPREGGVYLCVIGDNADDETNSVITGRPRAFGVADLPNGDIANDNDSLGIDETLSTSGSWVDSGCGIDLPEAGDYLIHGQVSAFASVTGLINGTAAVVAARVYDSTNSLVVPGAGTVVLNCTNDSRNTYGTGTFITAKPYTVTGRTTLSVQVFRDGSATWSGVQILAEAYPGEGSTQIGYIRLTNVPGGSGPKGDKGDTGATGPAGPSTSLSDLVALGGVSGGGSLS